MASRKTESTCDNCIELPSASKKIRLHAWTLILDSPSSGDPERSAPRLESFEVRVGSYAVKVPCDLKNIQLFSVPS